MTASGRRAAAAGPFQGYRMHTHLMRAYKLKSTTGRSECKNECKPCCHAEIEHYNRSWVVETTVRK